MWRPLWGVGMGGVGVGIRQKWDVTGRRGEGGEEVREILDVQFLYFFNLRKLNLRHDQTSCSVKYQYTTFLLTLMSDSETIPLWYHCVFSGLNRTTERVVNLNATYMTWFYLFFDFAPSHAKCGCCSIVSLRLQVVQKNRFIAKWILKM